MGNPTPPPSTQIATIPDLPTAGALSGAELIWINQTGLDRSVTASKVAALAGAGVYLPLTGGALTGDLSLSGKLTVGGMAFGTTPNAGDNSAAFATTAFVQNAIAGVAGVSSFNGRNGAVTLTQADVTGVGGATAAQLANYLPLAGGAISGALSVGGGLTATTPAPGDNTTKAATTAFVATALGGYLPLTGGAIGGPVTAPTPTAGDNSTNVATTAFVRTAVGAYLPLAGGTLTGTLTASAGVDVTGTDAAGNAISVSVPQPQITMNKQAGGSYANYIMGRTGGNNRWILSLGDGSTESGSNNGSLFQLYACNDAGANNTAVITCSRAAGFQTTFGGSVVAPYGIHYGTTANGIGFFWAPGSYLTMSIDQGAAVPILSPYPGGGQQGVLAAYVNTANTQGQFNTPNGSLLWSGSPSDRRLKSNLEPAGDALGLIQRLKVYGLDFSPNKDADKEHWPFSLIADEVAEVMPHAAMSREEDDGLHWIGLHPTHLCAVLWKAVQELAAEVEALKAAIAPGNRTIYVDQSPAAPTKPRR